MNPDNGRWKSRIVGAGEEDPEQLLANPENWRIHPHYQQDALQEILTTVGWVKPVIVNARTSHVVDGHLRIHLALARQEKVPTLYVDLSLEEERLVLAALDPLTGLAVPDKAKLCALMGDIVDTEAMTENAALRGVINVIAKQNSVPTPSPEEGNGFSSQLEMCICGCGHQHYRVRRTGDGEEA